MMKQKYILCTRLMVLLLFMNIPAVAKEAFSYQYFELGVGHSNGLIRSDFKLEGQGYFAKGAFDLSNNVYFGGYFDRKEINNVNDIVVANYGIFSGYHKSIKSNLDLYGEIKAFRFDSDLIGYDTNALGIGSGLKVMVTDKVELDASFYVNKIKDRDYFSSFGVESGYYFKENRSLRLKVESVDGELESQIGLRFSF